MRCRLKKAVQFVVIITGLLFYINFVFIARNSPSLSYSSGIQTDDDATPRNQQQQQYHKRQHYDQFRGEEQQDEESKQRHQQQQNQQQRGGKQQQLEVVLSQDYNNDDNAKDKNSNNNKDDEVLRFRVAADDGDRAVYHSSYQNESIYPSEKYYENDRILHQLSFVPPSIRAHNKMAAAGSKWDVNLGGSSIPLKKIHLAAGMSGWAIKQGQETFLEQKCRVPHCTFTDRRTKMAEADVVLFDGMVRANAEKPPGQIWVLYMLESPYHTPNLRKYTDKFNWTATYRHDSTIVAPYEKFVPHNDSVLTQAQTKNYASGKTKMVAWFVSNCGARNNRMQYAKQLGQHIEVDIYGRCGTHKCPRHQSAKCFEMLNNDYRFYLSFENSNCRDYITEKFFVNGLKHDVIPIVMGGAPEDYARAAPPHSYIHVDDFRSPKDLADYLNVLATNDKLYNEYFRWKGTGDIINTYFWCRVCALAHDVETRGSSWFEDVDAWWRGENVCIGQKSWRDVAAARKATHEKSRVIAPLAKWEPLPAKNLLLDSEGEHNGKVRR